MNKERLDRIIEGRLAKIKNTRKDKSKEYASIDDELANFKNAATLLKCVPEAALLGFVTKHIVTLYEFVADLNECGDMRGYSFWDEKIGDIIVYMVLLEALIVERLEKKSV